MIKQLAQLSLAGALSIATVEASEFEGAVIYEHADYGGDSLALYPGEGIPNLAHYQQSFWSTWNDAISSVAVWGPVNVYLYEHANYGGDVIVLSEHTDYLGSWWNDEVSSIWVEYASYFGWYEDYGLQSWVYWETDGWLWHEGGLGWMYAANYEPSVGGWLWDMSLGWVYTNASIYPWFLAPGGKAYYYYTGSSDVRWFYDYQDGWQVR